MTIRSVIPDGRRPWRDGVASTVLILDSNNLAMRSYHAAKGKMISDGGEITGPLHLFVRSLSLHLRHYSPDRFVACWDSGGSTFREQLYPDYKQARRAAQAVTVPHHLNSFGLIHEFLSLVGLRQWQMAGIEADDLIASAVLAHPDDHVAILSADKDLLQMLIRDGIEQVRFSSAGALTDVWDRDRVIDEMDCAPENLPYLMALVGDASDGVPGSRGLGPKKALRRLQEADWDWERAIATLPDRDLARTCLDLVDLGIGLADTGPVPVFAPLRVDDATLPRMQAFTDFCARYQLRQLWEDLVTGRLW